METETGVEGILFPVFAFGNKSLIALGLASVEIIRKNNIRKNRISERAPACNS